jgi:hypothetical protein
MEVRSSPRGERFSVSMCVWGERWEAVLGRWCYAGGRVVSAAVELGKGVGHPSRVYRGGRKKFFGCTGVDGESVVDMVEGFGKNGGEETERDREEFSGVFEEETIFQYLRRIKEDWARQRSYGQVVIEFFRGG